jgi:hypothetical protein
VRVNADRPDRARSRTLLVCTLAHVRVYRNEIDTSPFDEFLRGSVRKHEGKRLPLASSPINRRSFAGSSVIPRHVRAAYLYFNLEGKLSPNQARQALISDARDRFLPARSVREERIVRF